jgi:hypothetical protein
MNSDNTANAGKNIMIDNASNVTVDGNLTIKGTTALKNTTITGTLTVPSGNVETLIAAKAALNHTHTVTNLDLTGTLNPPGPRNKIHFSDLQQMTLEANSFTFSTFFQNNNISDLSYIKINQNTLASLIYDLIYPVGSMQFVTGQVDFAPLKGTWIEVNFLNRGPAGVLMDMRQYFRQS